MHIVVRDVLTGQTLTVELSGDTVRLSPSGSIPHEQLYLSPGWVDLQVNGFAGFDMNTPGLQPEHVSQMSRRL